MLKKISFFIRIILLLTVGFPHWSNAQSIFVLDSLPSSTPKDAAFFLTGSFNEWKASEGYYRFEKKPDGRYYTTPIFFDELTIMFLVTRGSWQTVEVEHDGLPTLTRKISFSSVLDTVRLTVNGWADFEGARRKAKKLTVQAVEIPRNTPPDSPIYITGNFNGWVPGDKRFQLFESEDGIYGVDVPIYWDRLAYKFTRGNWFTVEGKTYGRPRNDRVFFVEEDSYKEPLKVRITHWEDQSYGLFNPYTLILILTAIQGLFLILIINSYENNNKKANRILSLLIFLISFVLLTRVSLYDRELYNSYPRLSLLQDLVYFLYAPIFLIYIRRLLKMPSKLHKIGFWLYFLPFVAQVGVYLIFFFEPLHLFIGRAVSRFYPSKMYITIGGLALLFNIWFWFKIKQIIKNYLKNVENTYSQGQDINYLNTVMLLKALCLGLWAVVYLVGSYGFFVSDSVSILTLKLVDGLWVLFSFTVYLLGYYAIKQPAIFKIHEPRIEETQKAIQDPKDFLQLKQALISVMESEKAYRNPSLNLPELAQKMNSNVHVLSRAINEGFDKNFRDFVNYYRVMDFIDRAKKESYRNQTFLGIALDVGFNSKSSFNRSFKKITGKSPREYFQ